MGEVTIGPVETGGFSEEGIGTVETPEPVSVSPFREPPEFVSEGGPILVLVFIDEGPTEIVPDTLSISLDPTGEGEVAADAVPEALVTLEGGTEEGGGNAEPEMLLAIPGGDETGRVEAAVGGILEPLLIGPEDTGGKPPEDGEGEMIP